MPLNLSDASINFVRSFRFTFILVVAIVAAACLALDAHMAGAGLVINGLWMVVLVSLLRVLLVACIDLTTLMPLLLVETLFSRPVGFQSALLPIPLRPPGR